MIKKTVFVMMISFCVIWIIYGFNRANKLRENHSVTVGSVISADKGGKGKRGRYIRYEYNVSGERKTSGNQKEELEHSSHHLIGKSFPVVYRDGLFGYDSYLLITPDDFKAYGHDFPDSLKWVLEYIDKQ